MLTILEKGPAHPGMEVMRQELQKSITAAEQAVWSAQPGEVKRQCTVEVLGSLSKEEAECSAAVAKLTVQMEALVARRDRIRKDIAENQGALEAIEAGILADAGRFPEERDDERDEWMDRDDGYYGWHNGWRDDYGGRQHQGAWQDGYGGQLQAYTGPATVLNTGQLAPTSDQSYLVQLQLLYNRLGAEATPASLQQAALLTNHFAEKVTELLAAALPAPATPLRSLPLASAQTPLSAGGSAAPGVPSPAPARSPVVKVEAPTAAGRKVKDGKEKSKSPLKPKREKRVSVAASEEVNSSDESEDDMEDGAAAPGGPLAGEAVGAAALGFRPAAGADAAP